MSNDTEKKAAGTWFCQKRGASVIGFSRSGHSVLFNEVRPWTSGVVKSRDPRAAAVFVVRSPRMPGVRDTEKDAIVSTMPDMFSWMGVVPDEICQGGLGQVDMIILQGNKDQPMREILDENPGVPTACKNKIMILDETGMIAGQGGIAPALIPATTFSRQSEPWPQITWKASLPDAVPQERIDDIFRHFALLCRIRTIAEIYPWGELRDHEDEPYEVHCQRVAEAYKAMTCGMFELPDPPISKNDCEVARGLDLSGKQGFIISELSRIAESDPRVNSAYEQEACFCRAARNRLVSSIEIWEKSMQTHGLAFGLSFEKLVTHAAAGRIRSEDYIRMAKACGVYSNMVAHFEKGVPLKDLFVGMSSPYLSGDLPF